jgi:hypothetical protein
LQEIYYFKGDFIMADYERDERKYERRGLAGTALGLAAGALGVNLVNGGLGNILGGCTGNCNYGCNENMLVNRYEAQQQARIAELETEVKLRDSYTFTMGEMGKFRDYVDSKFSTFEKELCDQKVYNATNTATIGCIANQVNQLMALTKIVIPITNVCPQPAVATTTA